MKLKIQKLFMLCLFGMISMGAKAEDIPNNEIWYEASEQLAETTSTYSSGLHIDAFNTTIKTHTFSAGKGIITFNADVTLIGDDAFFSCSSLTSVTIPNSVTSIGNYAFYWCSGLTSMTIPNSVTSVGRSAFFKCIGLTSVPIGNSVISIGSSAFEGCKSLTSVIIPNSVTSIGESAFSDCYNLTSVTIPNSVISIGSDAFSGSTSLPVENNLRYADTYLVEAVDKTLSTYNIKEDTKWIGSKAFYDCKNLTSIEIPNSVTSIGSFALQGCSGLTSIEIPNSVISIGSGAFQWCYSLTSVNITDLDKWAEIEFEFFDANPLYYAHNLYLNEQLVTEAKMTTVQKIGAYAFYGCSGLKSVTIENSVTSIGEEAFCGCSGMTSVTIPNSVTSIGRSAFSGCSGLKSVNITDLDKWAEIDFVNAIANPLYYAHNLYINGQLVTEAKLTTAKKIESYAFSDCSLTSVTIPNSVTSIGQSAFYGCSGLGNIIADGINAPTTGSYSFDNVKNCSLHVPLGSEEAYASNFGTYFKSGNSYGNTIETYSAYSRSNAGVYSFDKVWDASSDVVLGEGIEKVYVPVEATVNDLKYKRTFNNTDWQALYVPFELDVKNDLADFSVYKISTSSADAINVTLMTEDKTSANTPYLIKAKATGEKAISVSSKIVKVTEENTNSELSDFEIIGTYEKLKYGDISGDWYALKGGKFMKAGEGAYLNPYRFYLKRKASSAKESIDININEPTGITSYENPSHRQAQGKLGSGQAQNENLYNLNGMRVDSNYKGIVIINGKKYLKK